MHAYPYWEERPETSMPLEEPMYSPKEAHCATCHSEHIAMVSVARPPLGRRVAAYLLLVLCDAVVVHVGLQRGHVDLRVRGEVRAARLEPLRAREEHLQG